MTFQKYRTSSKLFAGSLVMIYTPFFNSIVLISMYISIPWTCFFFPDPWGSQSSLRLKLNMLRKRWGKNSLSAMWAVQTFPLVLATKTSKLILICIFFSKQEILELLPKWYFPVVSRFLYCPFHLLWLELCPPQKMVCYSPNL